MGEPAAIPNGEVELQTLLEVQDRDTTTAQLRHRRRTLDERARLAHCEDELALLRSTTAEIARVRHEAISAQRRLEGDLASVEEKIAGLEKRLYSGSVTVPRELQAMAAELDALGARRATLEDQVLEAMAAVDPFDARLAQLDTERSRLDDEAIVLRAAVAEAETVIDLELVSVARQRAAAAAQITDGLRALYDQLRAKLDGVGVARLTVGRCGGCHLSLSAGERDRIKHQPPGALLRCEHCDRLLVRPAS